jgi:hypothetical protein
MSISRHEVLASVSHERHLPPNWTVLYALSRVNPAVLEILIRRGVVNPRTERHEAEQMQLLLTLEEAETFEVFTPDPDFDALEDAVRSLRYGLAKFIEAVNDRLGSDDPMTESQLELVIATVSDAHPRSERHRHGCGRSRPPDADHQRTTDVGGQPR